MNIEKLLPTLIDLLVKGKKVQLELDKKNNCIKLLEISTKKVNI